MAKSTSSVVGVREQPAPIVTDNPAVGLVVRPGAMDNALAGAILHSIRHGHEVLLTVAGGSREDLVEQVGHLPVTIVDPEGRPGEKHPIEHLARVARDAGFPGLIHYESFTDLIDFEQSTTAVRDSNEYCVAAVPSSKHPTHKQIIAGIPAFNEALSIGSVVHEARQHVDQVIVIDDGSDDRTATIARQAGALVLEHDSNRGKGAGIRTLLEHVDDRRCDALVLLDGDGQHDPADIPRVVEPVLDGDADLVIGSRYLERRQRDETPRYRRIGQQVLDLLTFGTSKRRVTDTQSGLRALSPTAIDRISVRTDGFGAESEMIDSAASEGMTIDERPIDVRYDGIEGHTKNPLSHGLEVVGFVVHLVRDRHPLLFFGIPGLVVTLAGVLYGIDGILVYQATGRFYPAKVFTSGFLTIVGVLGVFVGLVLNQLAGMMARFESAH